MRLGNVLRVDKPVVSASKWIFHHCVPGKSLFKNIFSTAIYPFQTIGKFVVHPMKTHRVETYKFYYVFSMRIKGKEKAYYEVFKPEKIEKNIKLAKFFLDRSMREEITGFSRYYTMNFHKNYVTDLLNKALELQANNSKSLLHVKRFAAGIMEKILSTEMNRTELLSILNTLRDDENIFQGIVARKLPPKQFSFPLNLGLDYNEIENRKTQLIDDYMLNSEEFLNSLEDHIKKTPLPFCGFFFAGGIKLWQEMQRSISIQRDFFPLFSDKKLEQYRAEGYQSEAIRNARDQIQGLLRDYDGVTYPFKMLSSSQKSNNPEG